MSDVILSEEEREAQLRRDLKAKGLNDLQKQQMQTDFANEAAERQKAREAAQARYDTHKGRR